MKMLKILFISFLVLVIFISGCSGYITKEICGTHTEKYTSNVKGCDQMENCRCLHKSWGGLGACDSCECTEEVSNC